MRARIASGVVAVGPFAACGDESPVGGGGAGGNAAGATRGAVVAVGAGGAGGAAASGGGGGAAVQSRSISIAYRAYGTPDPDTLMVMIHHVDGTLVTTLPGSQLPAEATVVDGDTVTYMYVSSSSSVDVDHYQFLDSYRVTPEVDGLEIETHLYFDVNGLPPCPADSLHVTAHLPAIGGAAHGRAWFPNGRVLDLSALPGDLVGDVSTCGMDGTNGPVLLTLTAADGTFAAFEMIEDVALSAGTSIELNPTFAASPRTPITFDAFSSEPTTGAWGDGFWRGDSDLVANEPFLFAPFEAPNLVGLGATPLLFTTTPPNLPHGQPMGLLRVSLAPDAGACSRGAAITRRGASATLLTFQSMAWPSQSKPKAGFLSGPVRSVTRLSA